MGSEGLHNAIRENREYREYQPSGEGGARLPPATPHRLQNPKWPPGAPKMAGGIWKNEDNLKNEDDLKNENDLKNKENFQKMISPTPHLKEYYLKFF